MSYKVVKIISPCSGSKKLCAKEFICDTEADIQNLPRYDVKGTQVLNDGDDLMNNEQ